MAPVTEGPDESGIPHGDTLNGWKEIAGYLGKSVRSVQRWERDLELPVHRIVTPRGQIVYGHRHEIDQWRLGMDRRPGALDDPANEPDDAGQELAAEADASIGVPSTAVDRPDTSGSGIRIGVWLTAILCLAAAGGIGWAVARRYRSTAPDTFVLVGRALEARDRQGRVVWTYPFDSSVSRVAQGYLGRAASNSDAFAHQDLDGDGRLDVLVPVHFDDGRNAKTDVLLALSDDGRPLWSVTSLPALTCGGETFSAPWFITAILVSSDPGPKRVWVSYEHNTWWPSLVMEIGPDGRQRLVYLQAGWVMSLDEIQTSAGPRLVAGGVMNEPERASMAWIDPDGPAVASPAVDERFQCADAPPAHPERIVLFPAFEVPAAAGFPYVPVDRLRNWAGGLRAEIDGGSVVAQVTSDGTVTELFGDDRYWLSHRKLESTGQLNHTADDCPERTRPMEIRTWTPAAGWQTYTVGPSAKN